MSRLRVLDANGDRHISWDAHGLQAGDPEALAAVQEAERIFAEQRARGAQAFRLRRSGAAERLDTFDPEAETIIIVPRVVGG